MREGGGVAAGAAASRIQKQTKQNKWSGRRCSSERDAGKGSTLIVHRWRRSRPQRCVGFVSDAAKFVAIFLFCVITSINV